MAVLKLISDFYSAADKGEVSLLGLLDLLAAFDTVDHSILINRLQNPRQSILVEQVFH